MKTIIIVEGKSDTRRLKEIYPEIITFQTSGLGLDEQKINELKQLEKKGAQLICLTDPDYPGERIRQQLSEHLPSLQHAYCARSHAISKSGKVGIEAATSDEIKRALANVYHANTVNDVNYTLTWMMDVQLAGDKKLRELFCDKLGIAFGNNKKVLKQLNNFGIDLACVNQVIGEINEHKS